MPLKGRTPNRGKQRAIQSIQSVQSVKSDQSVHNKTWVDLTDEEKQEWVEASNALVRIERTIIGRGRRICNDCRSIQ